MSFTVLPKSFRGRLALLFGFLSFLVGLPTYLYLSSVYQEQLIDDQYDAVHALAKAAATVYSENLLERRREIELLSQTPLYRKAPLDSPEFQASLERLKESYPHYSWLGLADDNGTVRAASSGHLVGVNVSSRPWFSGGSQGIFSGDLHEALLLAKLLKKAETGQPIRFVDFSVPVYGDNGKLRGVLGAHIHWQWANRVMAVVTPPNAHEMGLDMFVVNKDNHIIFPEGTDPRFAVPKVLAEEKISHGEFINWDDGKSYLSAAAAILDPVSNTPLGWRIVARKPRDVVLADVTKLQRIVLSVSVVAALVFLLLAWGIASSVSGPLERLTERARRLEQGDEETSFDVQGGSTELRRLSSALQGMAGKLLDSKHMLEARVAERTEALQRLNKELEGLARTDTLTQVPNRLAANERLELEFSRFQRSGMTYSVLMMDIDLFKRINDSHGHPVGDTVLRHVAAVISHLLRQTDFMARVGGEEFQIVLPMTPLVDALGVAEQIRAAVNGNPIDPVGTVTISIGAATVESSDTNADAAVLRADQCLYQAKEQGRNRVVGNLSSAIE